MNVRHAVFPGSFDPPTMGHIDIIERAAALFEKLYVVIAKNSGKNYLFSVNERLEMLKDVLAKYKNVEVVIWDSLVVNFAKKYDAGVIIRGVRTVTDYSYEFELAETNKQLCPNVEVLFMPTNPKYFLLRSSTVREIAVMGADISYMVPEKLVSIIKTKCKTL